jgi:Rad3-related DNA helicase
MAVDFIKHFPFESIRKGQEITLQTAQDTINDYDVLVVRAPVGAGKSGIAIAMQEGFIEAGYGCNIIVPNNMLRQQYLDEFPQLKTVLSQNEYVVPTKSQFHGRRRIPHSDMTVKEFRKQYGTWPRNNPYFKATNAAKKKLAPTVFNYYSYLAHAKTSKAFYKDNLIIDEAHQVLEMLKDIHAKKIWKHKVNYPDNLRSFGDLLGWAEKNTHLPNISLLVDELSKRHPASVIEHTHESYHGEFMPCIKIKPLSVADKAPFLWPGKIKRIILMSATISQKDIEFMGLGDRVVRFVDTLSPIPVERRPLAPLNIANMSYSNQEKSIPLIADQIKKLADKHAGESGLVHATYGVAQKLKTYLKDDDRFIFHNQLDKSFKFKEFVEKSDKVLIGSGFAEGIDLKGDLARWQAIAKIPYPSLADSSNRWLANNDSEYYTWLTAREVLQMYGRVSRGEDDYGITYVLDSSWESWYDRCESLLPKWFRESIQITKEKIQ